MPQSIIDQHQRNNFFQTTLLLLAMAAVMCFAGYLLFGTTGMLITLGLVAFGMLFSGKVSTGMILRAYQAQPITFENAPALVETIDTICSRADIAPIPLFYIPSKLPNAFAAGSGKRTIIAVTDGLLRMLTHRELSGVLAHEVAHVVNHDIRVLSTADAITRTTSFLARFGLFMMLFSFSSVLFGLGWARFALAGLVLFFAPAGLVMLQLAISRTREFDADITAAEITGDPLGLAMALQKIDPPQRPGIFQRILHPGPKRTQPAMLRTHPPTEERVERLQELANHQQTEKSNRQPQAPDMPFVVHVPPVERRPRYHPTNGLWW